MCGSGDAAVRLTQCHEGRREEQRLARELRGAIPIQSRGAASFEDVFDDPLEAIVNAGILDPDHLGEPRVLEVLARRDRAGVRDLGQDDPLEVGPRACTQAFQNRW